jgi:hypothetical protein
VASNPNLFRSVVIDVLLYFNFAAIKKHPRLLFRTIAIHTYKKYLNPSGNPVPLNTRKEKKKKKD